MQVINLLWGILSAVGMIIAFFPCLGALNWLNIPFSGLGLLVNVLSYFFTKKKNRFGSIMGIILCGTAIIIGLFRLALGFGVI